MLGQELGVAAENDVHASTGHVRRHGDPTLATGLGHHLGLTEVLLGVEDVVGYALFFQQPRQQFGLGHRGRAHQDRLAGLVAFDQILDHGTELGLFGLEDQVGLVGPDHVLVGGYGDDRQPVGAGKLARFGFGRPGHAGQFLVHSEVVL